MIWITFILKDSGGGEEVLPPSFLVVPQYKSSIRYVWNKAIASYCDVYPVEGIIDDNERNQTKTWKDYIRRIQAFSSSQQQQQRVVIVYLVTTQLHHFITEVLPNLTKPFVLVTGCADMGPIQRLGGELKNATTLLTSPLLRSWFAQNCDFDDAVYSTNPPLLKRLIQQKVRCVPIGLDLHTQAEGSAWWGGQLSATVQDNLLESARLASTPFPQRNPTRVFMDFSVNSNNAVRGPIYTRFQHASYVDKPWLFSLRRVELWKKYSQYAFVLSPPGNGKDCHRTWEALILGAVPIMVHSSIDTVFDKLPVVFVTSWDEVTEDALRRWHAEITNRYHTYDFTRLENVYWAKRIQNAALGAADARKE
eukprot:PhF_6_TR19018/c0_g1_i2/m.27891